MVDTLTLAWRRCDVEGCEKVTHARGLCHTHYSQWRGGADLGVDAVSIWDDNLPNPWVNVSPPCPRGHPSSDVFLWHPSPEDGGRWFCSPCGRRF